MLQSCIYIFYNNSQLIHKDKFTKIWMRLTIRFVCGLTTHPVSDTDIWAKDVLESTVCATTLPQTRPTLLQKHSMEIACKYDAFITLITRASQEQIAFHSTVHMTKQRDTSSLSVRPQLPALQTKPLHLNGSDSSLFR